MKHSLRVIGFVTAISVMSAILPPAAAQTEPAKSTPPPATQPQPEKQSGEKAKGAAKGAALGAATGGSAAKGAVVGAGHNRREDRRTERAYATGLISPAMYARVFSSAARNRQDRPVRQVQN